MPPGAGEKENRQADRYCSTGQLQEYYCVSKSESQTMPLAMIPTDTVLIPTVLIPTVLNGRVRFLLREETGVVPTGGIVYGLVERSCLSLS